MYFDRLSSLFLQPSAWLQGQVPLSSTSVTAAVSRNDFQWDDVGFVLPDVMESADNESRSHPPSTSFGTNVSATSDVLASGYPWTGRGPQQRPTRRLILPS